MKSFIGRKSSLITSLQSAIRNPQSAITVVFAAMLAVSWRRWISPVTDSGREMDLPLRLRKGEALYRDVYSLYPPFSPYFHSFLYRVFGAHLDVLQTVGAICAVLVVWMCYRIARRLMTPSESAIAVIAVILLCVFKPAGNLIWPYTFAALHGMVFALGALLLALRYAENGKRRELIAAGVLIGLAAITKQEFALAAACAVAAAVAWTRRNGLRGLAADLALAAAPALLLALPVYAALIAFVGWKIIVEDCHLFYTHLPASLVFYNSQRTGLDQPLFSFAQMIGAAAVGTAALSAIALLSARGGPVRRARWIWIALAGSLLIALAIRLVAVDQWYGSPMRALPFLLVAMIVIARRKRRGALFIIAVYSLAVLARVALRVPSGGAFGAFFLPTSLILFCYLFLRLAPAAVGRWTRDQMATRRARLIGAAMLIALLLP